VFDHVTIRASDREASERFYALVLRTIGIEPTHRGDHVVVWQDFSLAAANDDRPVTRRLHLAFVTPSRSDVDEFWRVGTGAGYRDDGAPGPRPQYGESYYGGFLLDPDGNSAEAVHHDSMRTGGCVDHLWIRVADVEASRRFYELVGAHAGFRLRRQTPERAQFVGTSTSTSHSPRARTPRCARSTPLRSPRAIRTTARRASARSTTRATTARSCSTRTGTTSSS
jgi:catechol 2,3-dioxygenase-like lactoylglutathione lyase family enzyme